MQKTPFYVRTRKPEGSFTDQETGVSVHGHMITKIDSPVGKLTKRFLQAGGLIIVDDEAVKKAKKEGRIYEGDVFTRKTKIKMVDAPEGSLASKMGMKTPVEVPLDDEELEQQEQDEDEDNAHFTEDEDQEEGEDAPDEDDKEPGLEDALNAADKPKVKKKDGVKPVFTQGISKK